MSHQLNLRELKLQMKKQAKAAEAAANPVKVNRIIVEPNPLAIVTTDARAEPPIDDQAEQDAGIEERPEGAVLKKHGSKKRKAKEVEAEEVPIEQSKPKKKKSAKSASADALTPPPADIPKDRFAGSAALFSKVTFPGVPVPSLDDLVNPEGYGRLAYQGIQFNAEVNRTLTWYEGTVSKLNSQVRALKGQMAETKEKVDEELKLAAEQVKGLEEECTELKRENNRLAEVEEEKDQVISKLKVELDAVSHQARKEVKGSLTPKLEGARTLVADLSGDLLKNLIFDRQNAANLTLLEELKAEEAKTEGKKSLDDFEAEVKEWSEEFAGAGSSFDKAVSQITGMLVISPEASPTSSPKGFETEQAQDEHQEG